MHDIFSSGFSLLFCLVVCICPSQLTIVNEAVPMNRGQGVGGEGRRGGRVSFRVLRLFALLDWRPDEVIGRGELGRKEK